MQHFCFHFQYVNGFSIFCLVFIFNSYINFVNLINQLHYGGYLGSKVFFGSLQITDNTEEICSELGNIWI